MGLEDEDEDNPLSELYNVVNELRANSEEMEEIIFPRGVKNKVIDLSGTEEDLWFYPIEMTKKYFTSLSDREVVQYILSQQMIMQ